MKLLWETAKNNLMYLAMLALALVMTFNMTLFETEEVMAPIYYNLRGDLSRLPVLTSADRVPVVSAQGVIAVDLDSRVILYEKNPDLPLLPASTTKIMTAMVAMDYYRMDESLVVDGGWVEGQKMGLVWGEELAVRDLLSGLLIYSANDAAEVLASNYTGGRAAFIEKMNRKAWEFGLKNTHFTNPSGLEDVGHVSTARDMVFLADVAMRDSRFSEIVGTEEKVVTSVNGKVAHRLSNINELLGEVDGVLGVKTGWTENARENLVTYVERDGKRVLIALLGSQDRFGETREIIDWIYGSYDWRVVQAPSYSP